MATVPLQVLKRCASTAAAWTPSPCVRLLPEVAEALRLGRPGEYDKTFDT